MGSPCPPNVSNPHHTSKTTGMKFNGLQQFSSGMSSYQQGKISNSHIIVHQGITMGVTAGNLETDPAWGLNSKPTVLLSSTVVLVEELAANEKPGELPEKCIN